jgi:hypothetical protein
VSDPAPNQHSTCPWVDEAYARRLWAQLLKRPFPNRASLLTVRSRAEVLEVRIDGKRYWAARCFAAGPNDGLDVMLVTYRARGTRYQEYTLLRITAHAGRRMFQRLRTNSALDVASTAEEALFTLLRNRELWPEDARQGEETELALPWGYFHLVADGGVWIAKTFIPTKATEKAP